LLLKSERKVIYLAWLKFVGIRATAMAVYDTQRFTYLSGCIMTVASTQLQLLAERAK